MRIAMLSWETLHSIAVGGVAAHVTELAAALQRKGHDVHIFTRMASGQADYELVHGVHYHRCPFFLNPDFVTETHNMCQSFTDRVFATEDLGGAFDIVHAHDWLAARAMLWVKNGRGRRGIFTVHSTEYGRSGNNFYPGPSARIREIEREGCHAADWVIAVSGATCDEVKWMYEVPHWKLNKVYNGVSAHRFDGFIDPAEPRARFGVGPTDPTVLFCGRLTSQKGPDLLLDAIPMVCRFHPYSKYVFVGDGDMRTQLQQRAAKLAIESNCRFIGFRSGQELIDIFKMVDCVCVPSRNEPFGIVVLEAWSAGKPVVVTKSGGPDEYVWHDVNGLKVNAYPESIAWGIGSIFANFEHARWLGRNGRQAVEDAFNWDKIADQTLGVYHR